MFRFEALMATEHDKTKTMRLQYINNRRSFLSVAKQTVVLHKQQYFSLEAKHFSKAALTNGENSQSILRRPGRSLGHKFRD